MRECLFCGADISSRHKSAKYCSDYCREEDWKKIQRTRYQKMHNIKTDGPCIVCGKTIIGKTAGAKYCSNGCRRQNDNKDNSEPHGELIKICPVCNTEFKTYRSRTKCCSEKCSYIYHNSSEESRTRDKERYRKNHPEARSQEEISKEAEAKRIIRKSEILERQKILEEQKRIKELQRLEKQNRVFNIVCPCCEKTFESKYSYSKYCSDECKRKQTNINHRTKKRYKGITVNSNISLFKLAQRDNNQCQICGLLVDWDDKEHAKKTIICGDMYPSIDHIIPISKGGLHSWNNIQLAHRKCNYLKKDKII